MGEVNYVKNKSALKNVDFKKPNNAFRYAPLHKKYLNNRLMDYYCLRRITTIYYS